MNDLFIHPPDNAVPHSAAPQARAGSVGRGERSKPFAEMVKERAGALDEPAPQEPAPAVELPESPAGTDAGLLAQIQAVLAGAPKPVQSTQPENLPVVTEPASGAGNLPATSGLQPGIVARSAVEAAARQHGQPFLEITGAAQPIAENTQTTPAEAAGTPTAQVLDPAQVQKAQTQFAASGGIDLTSVADLLEPQTNQPAALPVALAELVDPALAAGETQASTVPPQSGKQVTDRRMLAEQVAGAAEKLAGAAETNRVTTFSQAAGKPAQVDQAPVETFQLQSARAETSEAVQPANQPVVAADANQAVHTGVSAGASTAPLAAKIASDAPAEVIRPGWVDQIEKGLQLLSKSGKSTLKLNLQPQELGQIELRVTTEAGAVAVTITAERAATANLLESQLKLLKQSLQEAGVQLGGLSVGQGSEHAQSQANAHTGNHSSAASLRLRNRMSTAALDENLATPVRGNSLLSALDVRV